MQYAFFNVCVIDIAIAFPLKYLICSLLFRGLFKPTYSCQIYTAALRIMKILSIIFDRYENLTYKYAHNKIGTWSGDLLR